VKRQQVISGVLLIGLLAGYWFTLGKPELREIRGLVTEIRSLQSTQNLQELQATYLQQSQMEVAEVGTWLEEVIGAHTVEDSAQDFLLQTDAELRDCGLTVTESQPGTVFARERLKEQSLELAIEGSPEKLLVFLRRMEQSRPFCRVTELRLQPGEFAEVVRARLVLTRLWREV